VPNIPSSIKRTRSTLSDIEIEIIETDDVESVLDVKKWAKRARKSLLKTFRRFRSKIYAAYLEGLSVIAKHTWTEVGESVILAHIYQGRKYGYCLVANLTDECNVQYCLDGWPPYFETIEFRVEDNTFILEKFQLYDPYDDKQPCILYERKLDIRIYLE